MTTMLLVIGILIGAYFIGSISFAIVVSRIAGLADPREYGSKNPGATNVLRSGKRIAALVTLLGDGLKGWFVVWLTKHLGLDNSIVALSAIAVFTGHLYPIFFRFQGGKGVATAAGIMFGITYWLGFVALIVWLSIAFIFRYSSLAALVSAIVTLISGFILLGITPLSIAVAIICLGMIYRHQNNIRNLLAGRESKIGKNK